MFDFCEHDLAGLLSNAHVKFTLSEIKKVMQMLLNGLYYIHRNKVMGNSCCAQRVAFQGAGWREILVFHLCSLSIMLAPGTQGGHFIHLTLLCLSLYRSCTET